MEITLEKIELVKDRTGVTYAEAKAALEAALEMCRPNFRGNLYGLLQKHRYTEVLPFTPEVARFLKRSQTYLS